MSLDAKKKRTLTFGVIALVALVGIVWAVTSTGDSATARALDRRVSDDSTDDEVLQTQDVAVRSSPQSRSGRSRLEGDSATEADQDDKLVAGIEKKTKRNKKSKRRRTKKQENDEEEAASSSKKIPHPPYGK